MKKSIWVPKIRDSASDSVDWVKCYQQPGEAIELQPGVPGFDRTDPKTMPNVQFDPTGGAPPANWADSALVSAAEHVSYNLEWAVLVQILQNQFRMVGTYEKVNLGSKKPSLSIRLSRLSQMLSSTRTGHRATTWSAGFS